jgi:predicted nicotinamide N-methyase
MGEAGQGLWDMILGSDVVYDYRFMRPLIKTYFEHTRHKLRATEAVD